MVGELTELVARHPLREGLRGALMWALYRAGRSSDALDCFNDPRRRLDEELGLAPGPSLEALQQAMLRHDPVRREQDVRAIRALLSRCRLVTLTGPGGVGKTRLAQATAESLAGAFGDGIRLVELADAGGLERSAGAEALAEQVMVTLAIRESTSDDDTRACFALACWDLESLRGNAEDARAHFAELGDLWGRLKTTDVLGRLAEINGDYDLAARLHRESLRIAQELETWPEMSTKLSGLGRIALLTQRYDEADDLHTRALRIAVGQGDQPAEQFAALGLALSARRQGRLDAAEEWLRPWLAWNRRRGDGPGLALVLAELGFIAEQRGDAGRAVACHRDGLAAAATTKDPRSVALALEGLAGAYSLSGAPERAARLLGTAATARERAGAPHPPAERGDVERIAARLRAALDEATYTREFTAGSERRHEAAAAAEGTHPRTP